MAMSRLFQPDKVAAPVQLDLASPLAAYQQAKQRSANVAQTKANTEMVEAGTELAQAKLSEFNANAPARQLAKDSVASLNKLTQDQKFIEFGKSTVVGLDPDSPTFENDRDDAITNLKDTLIKDYKLPADQATTITNMTIQGGGFEPEYIRSKREELGITKAEPELEEKVVGGQHYVKDPTTGKWTASDIEGATKRSGLKVTLPDGTEVSQGEPISKAPGLGTSATTQVQTEMLDADKRLNRFANIENRLTDITERALTLPGKIEFAKLSVKDKMGEWGGEWSKKEQKTIDEATQFYSQVRNNLNTYLNELSGAAVSVAEFNRIANALPQIGNDKPLEILKWLSGDGPRSFKAKLKAMKDINRAITARNYYINKHGLDDTVKFGEDVMVPKKDAEGNTTGYRRVPDTTVVDREGNIIDIDDKQSMIPVWESRGEDIEAEIASQYPNMPKPQRDEMAVNILLEEMGKLGN